MLSVLVVPFLSLTLFCVGFYVMTNDMAQMPMTVAFIVASVVAVTVNRKDNLQNKIDTFAEGNYRIDHHPIPLRRNPTRVLES